MATEELFQPHACSRLQKPSGVRWKGLWYLSLLVTSAATAVATAQEVAVAPVYSRSQSGTQTVCRLIQPESHPQLLARFRKAPDKDIGPAHVVTLQGASTWEVTFTGFPDEAEAAFQFAVDIWATFLSSPERIRVEAEFVDLGEPNLLGGAGPTVLVRDFPGDVPDTFFPVSLANALAGNDLFSGADIQVSINSDFPSWYFGIDANPPFNEVDFVSIVLHELAHGLGFSDSFKVDDSDRGSWGLGGRSEIFDRFVEDYLGQNLIDTAVYPQSSIALGSALTDDVFFYGANTSGAELYAPSTFQEGSSIAHLDEATYPSGGANGLMTPSISSGESHHNPGDVVQDILEDLGWRWSNGTVNHSPVADAGPSQEVDELDNVFLSGAGSFDPDGDALSFSWVQISGPAVSFDETARDPSFQAPDVDGDTTLTLSLTVDDGSASDSDQVNVLVLDGDSNQPPVADAGSDQTVDEGAPVTLDGTDSFDPDGDTLSFQWLQLLGPSVQLAGSDSALPTFTAPEVSSDTQLRFRLTVDDGQEGDTDTVDIEVNHIPGNLPPVARAGPDQAVEEGKQVQLDATSSFDPDGDDLTFSWVQTSGPEVQLPQPGPATLTFEAPLLEQDRVLRFRVTVSDGFLADSDETRVTVYDVKPFGFDLDFAQFAYGGGLASEIWLPSPDYARTVVRC